MISNPFYYKFHPSEFYEFSVRIISILNALDTEILGLSKPLSEASVATKRLGEMLKLSSGKDKTYALLKADSLRNDAISAIKHYLLACQKRNNTTWQVSAKLLIEAIQKYGWQLEKDCIEEESSKIEMLLNDLKEFPQLKEALDTLNMKEWLYELEDAQRAVDLHVRNCFGNISFEESSLCKEIKNSYDLVFRYVDVMQQIQPNRIYVQIINKINQTIDEFNSEVRSRANKNGLIAEAVD